MELGYRPFGNSTLLLDSATPSLGLILPDDFTVIQHNAFYSLGLTGILEEIERHHGAFTVPPPRSLAELRHVPFHLSPLRGVDGLLILYKRLSDEEVAGLQQAGLACIFVGRPPQLDSASSIEFDMRLGSILAVEHLARLGHKRIAFLGWRLSNAIEGFRDGLQRCGLPIREEWIVSIEVRRQGAETFPVISLDILNGPDRPTAIFCHGDSAAVDLIQQVRRNGLEVPRDLSVVGFDDLPLASACHPPLTTIRQPIRDMAARAVRVLIDLIAGVKEGKERAAVHRETVAPQLVCRESTAAPGMP